MALRLGLRLPPLSHSCCGMRGTAGSSRLGLPKSPATGEAVSLHARVTSLDQEWHKIRFSATLAPDNQKRWEGGVLEVPPVPSTAPERLDCRQGGFQGLLGAGGGGTQGGWRQQLRVSISRS